MGIIKPKRSVAIYFGLGLAAISAGVYGKIQLDARRKLLADIDKPAPSSVPKFRPPVTPEPSTWSPKVTRLRLPSYEVVDMTDKGVFLLLGDNGSPRTMAADQDRDSFQLVSGTNITAIDWNSNDNRLVLSPDGNLRVFTYSLRDYWTLHYEQRGFTSVDATAIRRTMNDGSRIVVSPTSVQLKKNGVLSNVYICSDSSFHSTRSLSVVEHGDDESIWVYESANANDSSATPRLIRVQGKNKTEYKLPFHYTFVTSVAQTGSDIIATMGSLVDKEASRAYRFDNGRWSELPIPAGYLSSTVRKITYDGLALGTVRDLDRKSMPVVWRDNQCYPLANAVEWPKYDNGTQIIAATRNGNVYVQPIYDMAPGSGTPSLDLGKNSYVLHIAAE